MDVQWRQEKVLEVLIWMYNGDRNKVLKVLKVLIWMYNGDRKNPLKFLYGCIIEVGKKCLKYLYATFLYIYLFKKRFIIYRQLPRSQL